MLQYLLSTLMYTHKMKQGFGFWVFDQPGPWSSWYWLTIGPALIASTNTTIMTSEMPSTDQYYRDMSIAFSSLGPNVINNAQRLELPYISMDRHRPSHRNSLCSLTPNYGWQQTWPTLDTHDIISWVPICGLLWGCIKYCIKYVYNIHLNPIIDL